MDGLGTAGMGVRPSHTESRDFRELRYCATPHPASRSPTTHLQGPVSGKELEGRGQ